MYVINREGQWFRKAKKENPWPQTKFDEKSWQNETIYLLKK